MPSLQGNLSEFVKVKPEAKAYYELGSAKLKFVLPKPGFLDGVKGREVAILRMLGVGFTYPGTARQVLKDVVVRCNLNSRVAVLGVRFLAVPISSLSPDAAALACTCGARTVPCVSADAQSRGRPPAFPLQRVSDVTPICSLCFPSFPFLPFHQRHIRKRLPEGHLHACRPTALASPRSSSC